MTNRWIASFDHLRLWIGQRDDSLQGMVEYAELKNPWFTKENTLQALDAIASILQPDLVRNWIVRYEVPVSQPARVGAVLAGNIPLVGFHDILCILFSGHIAKIKLSDKDSVLLPALFDQIAQFDPDLSQYWQWTDRLTGMDAVIATGSNQASQYFEKYFGHYPHIIRCNRNSVAILTGEESDEDLVALGADIFGYFGMGCRNVSALWVPVGYDFNRLLSILNQYKHIMNHNKYRNNFDYNLATFIINRLDYIGNDCIVMIERDNLASRIATLHYSYYEDQKALVEKVERHRNDIQCIVTQQDLAGFEVVKPGQAQLPGISDYADNVDTMQFLTNLPGQLS